MIMKYSIPNNITIKYQLVQYNSNTDKFACQWNNYQ